MAYRYPDNRPKTSVAPVQASWNWSSPPQVNPSAGTWTTSPEDSCQHFDRAWNWSSPPQQTFPCNTSYAGNMRMVSQNGYGFHGELVRPRNSFQPPPMTSTPLPELYGNHGFYGVSLASSYGSDQGLTEVLASYATRKSTVVFMDTKAISKRRQRYSRICWLLLLIFLIGVGTLSYWKAAGTEMKPRAEIRSDLPNIPEVKDAISSSDYVQDSVTPNSNPPVNIAEAMSYPIITESESTSTLATSNNPRDTPAELMLNSIIKEPRLESSQIKEQSAESAVHDKVDMKVIYSFDDDDRDLDNEARVETVIEKQVVVIEKSIKKNPGTESENKAKEKMPPRRAYPYPGPIPVMRNPGYRP